MADTGQPEETEQEGFRIHRRHFLASVLSGAGALVLQACSRAPRRAPPTQTPSPTRPGRTPSPTQPTQTPTTQPRAARITPTSTRAPSRTPSPVPPVTETQSVHLPVVGTSEEPTATPSPTPSPTREPTRTSEVEVMEGPTASPEPTATPRPMATPFPPGPSTKLGLFVGYQHPALDDLLHTGNVALVKTLEYDPNLMEHIKSVSPNTILVARYTPLGQLNLARVDPIAAAHQFVDLLLPIATEPRRLANIDAWEAYNEPAPSNREEMQRLSIFEEERTRLLAAAGVRSCIGNFATGQPPLHLWPDFFPAVRAVQEHNGFLGLHEYSAPYMWFGSGPYQIEAGQDEGDEGWLTLRYRKVYRQYLQPAGLEVPLVITETGIDGQVQNRPGPQGLGWLDFINHWEGEGQVRTSPAGFYIEQLAWYDAELREDPYVKGAAIFALAGPVGWESFEILGQATDILKQYFAVHPRR